MNQFGFPQGQNEGTKGGVAVLCICVVLIIAFMAEPLIRAVWQERKDAQAAVEAKEAEVQYRMGGVAEQIEIVDYGSLKEQAGFRLRNVTYFTYDSRGNQTAEDRYNPDGTLERYEHDTYDESGNRILTQSSFVDAAWDNYEEECYTYDEENRLVLEQWIDDGKLLSETWWRYMEDGNSYSLTQTYQNNGEKNGWYTKLYNGNGDKVLEYYYHEDGQVSHCAKYRYDEEGRQIYYISYNHGDESTTPLREVVTEYEDGQIVRTSYEPLGHLNSVHYLVEEGNSSTEMYYLAGYSGGSGGDGIYILGQEEPRWNRELKFWEGCWKTYDGDLEITSLNSGYDRMKSFYAYWYEDGRKVKALSCTVNGGICTTSASTYVYNGEGLLAERYDYGYSGECLEEELQDGTVIRLEYAGKGSKQLTRLRHTDTEGNVLREITFDPEREERIEEWYEPLKEQMWAEELVPTENGIIPADQEVPPETEERESDSEPDLEPMILPCYYVVEKGDSLWRIAGHVYEDPYKFVKIYEANRAAIGPDWNFIPVGMMLYLPE